MNQAEYDRQHSRIGKVYRSGWRVMCKNYGQLCSCGGVAGYVRTQAAAIKEFKKKNWTVYGGRWTCPTCNYNKRYPGGYNQKMQEKAEAKEEAEAE